MKKSLTLLCAAFALIACSNDERQAEPGKRVLLLNGQIETLTRGNIQDSQIEAGEILYAWISDATTNESLYKATKLTAQGGGKLSATEELLFPESGNTVNIKAIHGTFSESVTPGQTDFPTSVGFGVAADQSTDKAAYVQSDLLYASSDGVAPDGNPTTVSLKFYHMLSKLELKITKEEGLTEELAEVTLNEVAVGGTFTPTAGADLTQQSVRGGMIQAASETKSMKLGRTADGSASNDAIVVPQSIAGKTMVFKLSSGRELVYTIPEGKTFESGKKHVYTVTLKYSGVEVTSTIEPWEDGGSTEGEATLPGDEPTEPTEPAKVGDYFYSDGTYSTQLNPSKTVIGIVFQTDPNRIGQAEKDALAQKGVDTPNGLVMALKNAATDAQWSKNTSSMEALPPAEKIKDAYSDISGYSNCQKIKEKGLDSYPAFKAAENFGQTVKAPEKTTGWYLPSAGQWWDILQNLADCASLADSGTQNSDSRTGYTGRDQNVPAKLNERMKDISGGNKDDFNSQTFWSSSQYSTYSAQAWQLYATTNAYACKYETKNKKIVVRCVLAF